MSKIPETEQEGRRLLLDAKMYAALDSIAGVGGCFDGDRWWDEKVAEEIVESLQEAVDEVMEKVTDGKR